MRWDWWIFFIGPMVGAFLACLILSFLVTPNSVWNEYRDKCEKEHDVYRCVFIAVPENGGDP